MIPLSTMHTHSHPDGGGSGDDDEPLLSVNASFGEKLRRWLKTRSFVVTITVILLVLAVAVTLVLLVVLNPPSPRWKNLAPSLYNLHRPRFHLLPIKNWMNDPNGPVYYKDRYHLFFQYNPNGSLWGNMHWGHVYSDDCRANAQCLASWHHDSVALAPTKGGPDATGVFSGCVVIMDDGMAAAVYTGVVERTTPGFPFVQTQCVAYSLDDLLKNWDKSPQNPVIDYPPPIIPPPDGFRDPFLFRCSSTQQPEDEWCMLLGSGLKDQGGMLLTYAAPGVAGPWTYQGVYANYTQSLSGGPGPLSPATFGDNWECPARLQDGDWVALLLSIDRPLYTLHYLVGQESPSPESSNEPKFQFRWARRLDYGGLYAATLQTQANGLPESSTPIQWAWMREDRSDADLVAAGWAGVQALPRYLDLVNITVDGETELSGMHIRQRFAPELHGLRTKHSHVQRSMCSDVASSMVFVPVHECSHSLELRSQVNTTTPTIVGVRVLSSLDQQQRTDIVYDMVAERLSVIRAFSSTGVGINRTDIHVALSAALVRASAYLSGSTLELHVMVDHSTIEVLVNGIIAISTRVYPDSEAMCENILFYQPVACPQPHASQMAVVVDGWDIGNIFPDD